MKNRNAEDWVIILIGGGVGWIMFAGGLTMILTRSPNPAPELIRVRELLFSLAQTALGGLLVKYAMGKGTDKDENKDKL